MVSQISTTPVVSFSALASSQGRKANAGGNTRKAAEPSQADSLQSSIAQQKKQNAQDDLNRLKQQLADVAVLALINPKGAARIYAEMGKKLETAAKDYTKGAQDLERINGSPSVSQADLAAATTPEVPAQPTEATAVTTPPTPEKAAQDLAEDSALHAADRAQRLQQYATVANSTRSDKSVLTTIKSLGHTLEQQFRLAVQMAERQDSREENRQDLEHMSSNFAISSASWRDSAETLNQITMRAESAAVTAIATGPVSVVV